MPQIYTPASVGNRRAEVLYLQQWERNEMKEECVLRVAEDDIRRKQQKKSSYPWSDGLSVRRGVR